MKFADFLKNNIVYLDGGMGTLLQKLGLKPGEYPELWNITHPDIITNILPSTSLSRRSPVAVLPRLAALT